MLTIKFSRGVDLCFTEQQSFMHVTPMEAWDEGDNSFLAMYGESFRQERRTDLKCTFSFSALHSLHIQFNIKCQSFYIQYSISTIPWPTSIWTILPGLCSICPGIWLGAQYLPQARGCGQILCQGRNCKHVMLYLLYDCHRKKNRDNFAS